MMNTKDVDVSELIDAYMDQERMYSMEGSTGVKRLTQITKVLGYDYNGLTSFFEDNSGAIEAVIEWIKTQDASDWKDNLLAQIEGE
jgi:hypothetical protein